MRLCHRAGHAVPLLTVFTILAGCATSTVPQPPNFNQNPQVVAIYAVDSAFGTFNPPPGFGPIADVLIFSSNPADQGKISLNPPPSYGSYRVEFDQPVTGTTIANNADRAAAIGGTASFCSPVASTPIQLLDVDGGNRVVTSSVCYDSTSPLGSNPHVLLIPGAGAVTDPAAKPLTCNTFAAEDGSTDDTTGGNPFQPNHTYGIQVKPGLVTNGAGKPLSAPTLAGSGWTGDTFQFKTSGLQIMAAGFIDPNTAFFVWLDKPVLGFEKDLAPVPQTFQQPTDGSPFLIVLSEPVTGNKGDVSGSVTLVRSADNSKPSPSAVTAGGLGDPRIIEVSTGFTFEPGTAYTVTVAPTLTADSGDVLGGTPKVYTFTGAPGNAESLGITPQNGAQAQSFVETQPEFDFSVPITLTGATFKITGPNNQNVPLAAVDLVANNQVVLLTPAAPLAPETTYTASYTGVTTGPELGAARAGQPIADDSAQFTTSTFRLARLESKPGAGNNLDRNQVVDPVTVLKAGTLTLQFNNEAAPAGVSDSTVSISELDSANKATKIPSNVTPAAPANPDATPDEFSVALPGYQPKYGQKYEVRATTGITDPVSGATVKAEGCTGSGAACDDVKTFTTRKVGISIAPDDSSAPTGFIVTFTDPIDPASLTPFLTQSNRNGAYKLFERDSTGALSTTPTPINCSITDSKHVHCVAAPPGLGTSPKSFVASAVFLPTVTADPAAGGPSGPAIVASATSTDPSARFSGSANRTIFATCGP